MRSYDPTDEDDVRTVQEHRIEPWMLTCIVRNPLYPYWGPHEDCMAKIGQGWESPAFLRYWEEMKDWKLDDSNECVNFYFYAERDAEECAPCGGSGYNPETRRLDDTFYDLANILPGRPSLHRWCDAITQDEVDALWEEHRLRIDFKAKPTAEQVNQFEERRLIHDAINRGILVRTRATRLGVWGYCERCEGRGYVFTTETARLGLVLWMIHPRKGASRAVDVANIQQNEMPDVLKWLRYAADRNAKRFGQLG